MKCLLFSALFVIHYMSLPHVFDTHIQNIIYKIWEIRIFLLSNLHRHQPQNSHIDGALLCQEDIIHIINC